MVVCSSDVGMAIRKDDPAALKVCATIGHCCLILFQQHSSPFLSSLLLPSTSAPPPPPPSLPFLHVPAVGDHRKSAVQVIQRMYRVVSHMSAKCVLSVSILYASRCVTCTSLLPSQFEESGNWRQLDHIIDNWRQRIVAGSVACVAETLH